jgi:hypothetical protein
LVNNIKTKYETKEVLSWLQDNGFSASCRAEEINPKQFFNLYTFLTKKK